MQTRLPKINPRSPSFNQLPTVSQCYNTLRLDIIRLWFICSVPVHEIMVKMANSLLCVTFADVPSSC